MPIRRPPLVNGEIYHIVLRAIEGLKLFRGEKDNIRMVNDLFEFDDDAPVSSNYRHNKMPRTLLGRHERELLVEILAFCLMPNHLHLLVRQSREGGISKFMRKIGAGYGGYYNKKYQRKGRLFDGRYKVIRIANDNQLKIIFVYIHTNPVAILIPHWKEKGVGKKEFQKVLNFLDNYRWSSYLDYLGKDNFPSLISRDYLIKEMGGVKEARRFVNDWLCEKKRISESRNKENLMKDIILE